MKCAQCFFSDQPVDDEFCRRCSRNFTRAELLEVIVLGLMYVFICRFSHFLFTGDFIDRPLQGGILFFAQFSDVFLFPVSFAETPWHILTVGWLFALILLAPVFVGLFYGRWPGMVLALVGGYFVHAPFLFLLLIVSALMAATRVRKAARLSAWCLLSALPPFVYLVGLSAPAMMGRAGLTALLPWLVTLVLVLVSAPLVLHLACRHDYAMRFLLWFVGVQVAGVFILFYATVGFARVEYEFVRAEHWSGAARFRIPVTAQDLRKPTEDDYQRARELFEVRRERAIRRFTEFVEWFPRSSETPYALFELAEIRRMRPYFTRTMPDQLKGYPGPINAEALADYERIARDFSDSPAAVAARLRIAEYYRARPQMDPSTSRLELDRAVRELRDMVDFCNVKLGGKMPEAAAESMLARWRAHRLSSTEERQLYREVLYDVRRELKFIEANSDNLQLPLMLYYQLDAHQRGYPDEMKRMLKWFAASALADNLKLALMECGLYGPTELEALLAEYPRGDAAPRALLLLGDWYAAKDRPKDAAAALERLVKDFADTPEAARAAVMLKNLKPGS